jgi:hypothetical protein
MRDAVGLDRIEGLLAIFDAGCVARSAWLLLVLC